MAQPNGNSNIRTEEKDYVIGMRHERPDGYSISISRIVSVPINIPINILYDFWNNDSKRGKW
jgi:hypothetical protein